MAEEKKKQDTELLQLVTFNIGEEEFGVEILKVREIIRMLEITRVPRASEFVEGVINLRKRYPYFGFTQAVRTGLQG